MTATATRERPILFTGEMVRAILEGRKTQTRRVAKSRRKHTSLLDGSWADSFVLDPGNRDWLMAECPYGDVGDRLWVKETWMLETEQGVATGAYIYRAASQPAPDGDTPLRWRPSIHMPRSASRITLEIAGVRVERVQAITEADARAEGVEPRLLSDTSGPTGRERRWRTSVGVFQDLWDSINAKRGHGWETNPLVWVVEFKVVTA